MASSQRGADAVVRTLEHLGVDTVFALSGNHIMSLFDALIGSPIRLVHTRHEAAAVHMADAYARLTGRIGVALVTGGQGHTNAIAALPTAEAAHAPVLLLSGHAPTHELGRGAFQELAQADMARPVTKAAWTSTAADRLAGDVARAATLALAGPTGPVHLSLPSDLLEARVSIDAAMAIAEAREAAPRLFASDAMRTDVHRALSTARRPLVIAGPAFAQADRRERLAALEAGSHLPAVVMESPRGLADPALGAFAELLAAADLVVLLGKPHDFTLRFGAAPHVSEHARLVVIDPDPQVAARARRVHGDRLVAVAPVDRDEGLGLLAATGPFDAGWCAAVREAVAHRPAAWTSARGREGALHPLDLCRAIQAVVDRDPRTVFIADGGEIGQWAQAGVSARRRIINGVAGSIGAALPFALAARIVEPDAPVITVMGDGACAFHIAEIDTAVRHDLPFVAVVGNDARWNAEHQIQIRSYGADRTYACGLRPTRYDSVARGFGGEGTLVTHAEAMAPTLAEAVAGRRPTLVNAMIDGLPAPTVTRAS